MRLGTPYSLRLTNISAVTIITVIKTYSCVIAEYFSQYLCGPIYHPVEGRLGFSISTGRHVHAPRQSNLIQPTITNSTVLRSSDLCLGRCRRFMRGDTAQIRSKYESEKASMRNVRRSQIGRNIVEPFLLGAVKKFSTYDM